MYIYICHPSSLTKLSSHSKSQSSHPACGDLTFEFPSQWRKPRRLQWWVGPTVKLTSRKVRILTWPLWDVKVGFEWSHNFIMEVQKRTSKNMFAWMNHQQSKKIHHVIAIFRSSFLFRIGNHGTDFQPYLDPKSGWSARRWLTGAGLHGCPSAWPFGNLPEHPPGKSRTNLWENPLRTGSSRISWRAFCVEKSMGKGDPPTGRVVLPILVFSTKHQPVILLMIYLKKTSPCWLV